MYLPMLMVSSSNWAKETINLLANYNNLKNARPKAILSTLLLGLQFINKKNKYFHI